MGPAIGLENANAKIKQAGTREGTRAFYFRVLFSHFSHLSAPLLARGSRKNDCVFCVGGITYLPSCATARGLCFQRGLVAKRQIGNK